MTVTVEEKIFADVASVLELEHCWDEFIVKHATEGLCTQWLWLKIWLDTFFTPADELFVCCYFHNERLVGVIPCYLKANTCSKELRFIGTGEPECDEVCSEFQDFIIDEKYKNEVLDAFSLAAAAKKIKLIAFDGLLSGSNAQSWAKDQQAYKIYLDRVIGTRFLVPFDKSTITIDVLPGKSLRRKMRFAQKNDLYRVELLVGPEKFSYFFSKLALLHKRVWEAKGKAGVFSSAYFYSFHERFAKAMLDSKRLVMFTVNDNSVVLAVFYGIIFKDTLYYYQSGIERREGHNNLGAYMHYSAMEIAKSRGLKRYDLMKGSLNSYKKQYSESSTKLFNLKLVSKNYQCLLIIKQVIAKVKLKIKRIRKTI